MDFMSHQQSLSSLSDCLYPLKKVISLTQHISVCWQAAQAEVLLVHPTLTLQMLCEEGCCPARLLLAARWSPVRTLNHSAIPQQIEAVICKTTWLDFSCSGITNR